MSTLHFPDTREWEVTNDRGQTIKLTEEMARQMYDKAPSTAVPTHRKGRLP